MRAFESKKPDISSSERTKNLKSKTVFANMRRQASHCMGKGRNYTGTMIFNGGSSGTKVTNYRSYALANTMARGAALVWDNCCQGISGANNPFGQSENQLESWNANNIIFDWGVGPGATGMAYLSNSNTWVENELDNDSSNPTPAKYRTLDGSGVWIDPYNVLFGSKDNCSTDKFLTKIKVIGNHLDLSGNNTQNNYLVGYQQIGGHKNKFNSWLLWQDPATSPDQTGACNCKN